MRNSICISFVSISGIFRGVIRGSECGAQTILRSKEERGRNEGLGWNNNDPLIRSDKPRNGGLVQMRLVGSLAPAPGPSPKQRPIQPHTPATRTTCYFIIGLPLERRGTFSVCSLFPFIRFSSHYPAQILRHRYPAVTNTSIIN